MTDKLFEKSQDLFYIFHLKFLDDMVNFKPLWRENTFEVLLRLFKVGKNLLVFHSSSIQQFSIYTVAEEYTMERIMYLLSLSKRLKVGHAKKKKKRDSALPDIVRNSCFVVTTKYRTLFYWVCLELQILFRGFFAIGFDFLWLLFGVNPEWPICSYLLKVQVLLGMISVSVLFDIQIEPPEFLSSSKSWFDDIRLLSSILH